MQAVIISLLVCAPCLPQPSLHDSDFNEIFLLLVIHSIQYSIQYTMSAQYTFTPVHCSDNDTNSLDAVDVVDVVVSLFLFWCCI